MFPTFNNLDYLFIEKISYYFSSFKRGDVIVFRSPINESEFFIKRIIGLPGEKIEIKKGKIIIIKDDKNIEIEEIKSKEKFSNFIIRDDKEEIENS